MNNINSSEIIQALWADTQVAGIGMTHGVISSTFGYAGVIANLFWPTFTNRSYLLTGQALASALMLTHFALLHANSGAWIMGIAGVQALLAIPLGKSAQFKAVYLASLTLTPVVCVMTWQGPQSVYSSLALAFVCLGNFQLNQLFQRLWLIAAIFAWIAHNTLIASTPALISNALALAISAWMLIKTWRSPREASRPTPLAPRQSA